VFYGQAFRGNEKDATFLEALEMSELPEIGDFEQWPMYEPKGRGLYGEVKSMSFSDSDSLKNMMEENQFSRAIVFLKPSHSEERWEGEPPLVRAIRHSTKNVSTGGESATNDEDAMDSEEAAVLVEALLEAGFDANSRDQDSTSALSIAVDMKAFWAVESLVRHGADANAPIRKDVNDDKTALHQAAQIASTELIEVILSAPGAEIDILDVDGKMFLDYVYERMEDKKNAIFDMILDDPERHKPAICWALRQLDKTKALEATQRVISTSWPTFWAGIEILSSADLHKKKKKPLMVFRGPEGDHKDAD
jgi:hypothetical protein